MLNRPSDIDNKEISGIMITEPNDLPTGANPNVIFTETNDIQTGVNPNRIVTKTNDQYIYPKSRMNRVVKPLKDIFDDLNSGERLFNRAKREDRLIEAISLTIFICSITVGGILSIWWSSNSSNFKDPSRDRIQRICDWASACVFFAVSIIGGLGTSEYVYNRIYPKRVSKDNEVIDSPNESSESIESTPLLNSNNQPSRSNSKSFSTNISRSSSRESVGSNASMDRNLDSNSDKRNDRTIITKPEFGTGKGFSSLPDVPKDTNKNTPQSCNPSQSAVVLSTTESIKVPQESEATLNQNRMPLQRNESTTFTHASPVMSNINPNTSPNRGKANSSLNMSSRNITKSAESSNTSSPEQHYSSARRRSLSTGNLVTNNPAHSR